MKKPTCTLYIKLCKCTFFSFYSYLNETQKKEEKKTGNSYNLIANLFHVKTASKFKFIRKRKKHFLFFFIFFLNEGFSICPGRKSRTRIVYF